MGVVFTEAGERTTFGCLSIKNVLNSLLYMSKAACAFILTAQALQSDKAN